MEFTSWRGNAVGCYKSVFTDMQILLQHLNVLYWGVEIGQFFHGKIKPSHSLSVFHRFNRDAINCVELQENEVLEFLRKNTLAAELFLEGMNLICYKNHNIGFVKRIGNRVNNLYPKEYRILNM